MDLQRLGNFETYYFYSTEINSKSNYCAILWQFLSRLKNKMAKRLQTSHSVNTAKLET